MANLTYRESSTPTIPTGTVLKIGPLTNIEVDANFKSLDMDIQTRATVSQLNTAVSNIAVTTAALNTDIQTRATTAALNSAVTTINTTTAALNTDIQTRATTVYVNSQIIAVQNSANSDSLAFAIALG